MSSNYDDEQTKNVRVRPTYDDLCTHSDGPSFWISLQLLLTGGNITAMTYLPALVIVHFKALVVL